MQHVAKTQALTRILALSGIFLTCCFSVVEHSLHFQPTRKRVRTLGWVQTGPAACRCGKVTAVAWNPRYPILAVAADEAPGGARPAASRNPSRGSGDWGVWFPGLSRARPAKRCPLRSLGNPCRDLGRGLHVSAPRRSTSWTRASMLWRPDFLYLFDLDSMLANQRRRAPSTRRVERWSWSSHLKP